MVVDIERMRMTGTVLRRRALLLPGGGIALVLLSAGPAFAQAYSVATGQTTTVSGQIADGAAATSVSVGGGGTLVLTNTANSYSGGTSVFSGSSLAIDSDSQLGALSGSLTLGDATSNGTLSLRNSTALTSARSIVLNVGGGALSANPTAGATFSGVISGSGVLIVGGGGTVALTGINTYSGGTYVIGGSTLQIADDTGLGSTGGGVNIGDATTAGTLSWTNAAAATSSHYFSIGAAGGTILTNSAGSVTIGGGDLGSGIADCRRRRQFDSHRRQHLYRLDHHQRRQHPVHSFRCRSRHGAHHDLADLRRRSDRRQHLAVQRQLQFGPLCSPDRQWRDLRHRRLYRHFVGAHRRQRRFDQDGGGDIGADRAGSYTGGTTVNAGTLQLGAAGVTTASILGPVTVNGGGAFAGNGTVYGSVNNIAGLVSSGLGSSTGLAVSSYSQGSGGALNVLMTPTGAATLKVGGAASLAGALRVTYADGFYKAGSYALLTAGSLNGSFTTVSAAAPSVGLSEKVVENGNEIDLILTQLTTLPDHPTIFPAITTAAIDDAQRVNGTVLSHLVDVRTTAEVDNLTAGWSSSHRIISASPYGIWFQPTGNFGSQTSHSAAPGFDSNGFGFLAGIDGELARGLSAGFAAGFNQNYVNETGGAKATTSTPRLYFYGSWWSGPIAVDALVGYGYASTDSTRVVQSANQTAKGSPSANELNGALQASLGYSFENWALAPAVAPNICL